MTAAGEVTTLAGLAGSFGSADGQGNAARFQYPEGIAADAAGNIYVTDTSNHTIRKVTAAGDVTTLAGLAGSSGSADGQGSAARFYRPQGIAADTAGNLYVTDTDNYTIRKVDPAGDVTTLAGLAGSTGSTNGQGSAARFYYPIGVAVDVTGILYITDTGNNTIRKMTATGDVTTLAGFAGSFGSADGQGSSARFFWPCGIVTDAAGNLYVTDTWNCTIRKVTAVWDVATLAGLAVSWGSSDGQGSAARFDYPKGIAADAAGNLYIADTQNHTIRKVTTAGDVTTLAGVAESAGSANGQGSAARFYYPQGIAADAAGNLYITDTWNHTIRKVTPSGDVTTLAGLAGSTGSANGPGSAARFYYPQGIAADAAGNLYVTDTWNHTIRKVAAAGDVTTLAGLPGSFGNADGQGSGARFNWPAGIASDAAGNLYVTDTYNHAVRKVTPAGDVTTLAGGSYGSADGQGSAARFYEPRYIAADSAGNLYITDTWNQAIRKVTPTGDVTTLAGLAGSIGSANGQWSAGSAEGTGVFARFSYPAGIVIDPSGIIYVTDTNNHRVQVGRPGLADTATIDCLSVDVGLPHSLDVLPRTATSWQWTMIRRPSGSSAVLSATTVPNPSFTPDVADLYEFRVVASDAATSSITTVSLLAAPAGYYGNLDENASVDAGDSVILANFLVGNVAQGSPPFTAPLEAGDLNRDSFVNAIDAVILANYLVGNICGLPTL